MPVPQPEEVISLARELTEARERLADLEFRWAAFFTPVDHVAQLLPLIGLKARIIRFLEEHKDSSYNMASVAKALNANENSVGPYLSELAKDGKIEKRDRGLYGALRPPVVPDYGDTGITDDDIPF